MLTKNKPLLHLLLLFIVLLNFSGCTLLKEWKYLSKRQSDERKVYVVNHGWHTGIVVAQKDLNTTFDFLQNCFGYSEFYEFGWGDRAYYQAKEVTTGITLKAIFWPTQSVIHVVAVPEDPKRYFAHSQTLEIKVSKEGLNYLVAYLANSFKYDKQNQVIPTKRGLYGRSFFYESIGSFHIVNTCNTWTTRALEEAGLPVNSFLTLTAGSVIKQTEDAIKSYPTRFH